MFKPLIHSLIHLHRSFYTCLTINLQATENQVIKKKMLDAIFPDLKTNGDGIATYKGVPFSTSSGVCKAQRGLSNGKVS